jgi:hypothetical protein
MRRLDRSIELALAATTYVGQRTCIENSRSDTGGTVLLQEERRPGGLTGLPPQENEKSESE